jgi:5-methylcytosine-specific restriction endonuclease McrA
MIRLVIDSRHILARLKADWITRAKILTRQNLRAGRHDRRENIWSEVRETLAALQRQKCAYCERVLDTSGVESTVDHFRPKSRVESREWSDGAVTDAGGFSKAGYFLLAYDLDNYLVACRRCNNVYKGDYFPTSKSRRLRTVDADELAEEEPYLICPRDADPESAIVWHGAIPAPGGTTEFERRRALVTIELLGLAQEDLVRDRLWTIVDVWLAHGGVRGANPDPLSRKALDLLCASSSKYASCARNYRRLCETDLDAARRECEMAMAILEGS